MNKYVAATQNIQRKVNLQNGWHWKVLAVGCFICNIKLKLKLKYFQRFYWPNFEFNWIFIYSLPFNWNCVLRRFFSYPFSIPLFLSSPDSFVIFGSTMRKKKHIHCFVHSFSNAMCCRGVWLWITVLIHFLIHFISYHHL